MWTLLYFFFSPSLYLPPSLSFTHSHTHTQTEKQTKLTLNTFYLSLWHIHKCYLTHTHKHRDHALFISHSLSHFFFLRCIHFFLSSISLYRLLLSLSLSSLSLSVNLSPLSWNHSQNKTQKRREQRTNRFFQIKVKKNLSRIVCFRFSFEDFSIFCLKNIQ